MDHNFLKSLWVKYFEKGRIIEYVRGDLFPMIYLPDTVQVKQHLALYEQIITGFFSLGEVTESLYESVWV
jgi:hypothetical protein